MNPELIKKADLVLANLSANGGILNPEQSDTFFRNLIDQPTILGVARTVPMNAPSLEINKIGFGSRILRAASENTALAEGDRSKPDLGKVTLNTKEVIAEVRLPYGVLEDNIERGNMENTILALIAERAALDLEELVLLGDTASSDPYLALHDGVLKRIISHEVDCGPTKITPTSFSNAIKTMPPKYKRNKALLRFFTSFDAEQDYRLALGNRMTPMGDTATNADMALTPQGVRLSPVALMPDTTGLLIDPQNIVIGIQRNFQMESQRLISERQIKIVLTARVAIQLETEEASVKMVNLSNTTEASGSGSGV